MALHLARGEGRKLAAIVALCVGVAHLRRGEMRKRWLGADQEPKWQDHPAVAYLLGNASVVGTIAFVRWLMPPTREGSFWGLFARQVLSATVSSNLILFSQAVFIQRLYAHVKYFSDVTRPSNDLLVLARDYVKCNLVIDWINSAVIATGLRTLSNESWANIVNPPPVHLVPYLVKHMFVRLAVDVFFYIGHYWLHTEWAYKNIHYYHHEHTAPRTQTNYHFLALDLFIEGVLPVISALVLANMVGLQLSAQEQLLIAQTIGAFEAGSHSGKEVPTVLWFAPLSPLVDGFLGMEKRLVEFHTRHHQLFKCNYSIAPWPDRLMGTYKMGWSATDRSENDGEEMEKTTFVPPARPKQEQLLR